MKKRVLIAISTAETVAHEVMQSIYELEIPKDVETTLKIIHAYNIADGRNNLVNYMLSNGYDYILFVDNDVILPKNALVDLYNMQWYIATGTYPRKEMQTITGDVQYTTLYNHNERNVEVYCPTFMPVTCLQKGKITPVDCCGLGCTLIRKDLFSKIEKPYFFFAHEGNPAPNNTDEYCIGEDMYFCRKVLRAGIQIWAHGSVLCGHLGKFIYKFRNT
jgi:GT2 family glycosyltransferase